MIFSLSSGVGRSGIAVFRLSGEGSYEVAKDICRRKKLIPRFAHLSILKNKRDEMVDEALVLYFPSPNSFTGEDVIEFHCHGSPAVNEAMFKCLSSYGADQAEAGEFTRRAVLNGQMDLTEAEGLADLIDSETKGQHEQALRQMQGGLKNIYAEWKELLLDALAQIEGEIDFPDEEDIPDALSHKAYPILRGISGKMENMLKEAERGRKVRQGIVVTLLGAPNSGKSSIINRLAKNDIAIVTDKAGTTRDIISVDLIIGGLPVTISDTAGLRQTDDVIEGEGVRRARARAGESDLRIWVVDGTMREAATRPRELELGDVILLNKLDVRSEKPQRNIEGLTLFNVSAKTGEGFDMFQNYLEEQIKTRFAPLGGAGLTRERHKDCVLRAQDSVLRGMEALGRAPELAGEDIRRALQALRELAGDSDIESVFDRIFSRFCVGK